MSRKQDGRLNRRTAIVHAAGEPSPASTHTWSLGWPEITLGSGMLLTFVFLVIRSMGLYPSVFADEWTYSSGSRLMRFSSTATPLYLYYFVYRLTKFCGDHFLEGARVLNALFFVAAAPFIYATARRVTTKWIAVLVAMLALAGPISIYTAYFMPEAMYFFVFWLMTSFLFRTTQTSPARYGMTVGGLLGALMLVKVNAIFLLPGLALFLIYDSIWGTRARDMRGTMVAIVAMIGGAGVVRLGFGFLCARRAGLNVLGTRYGSLAESSVTPARVWEMTGQLSGILRGHLMALAFLFALPLAAIVMQLFGRSRNEDESELRAMAAYSLALLLPLLLVVAYFTVSVVHEGPYESLARLHMRYYDFLFPMFLIVVAEQISANRERQSRTALILCVIVVGGLAVYGQHSLLRLYTPSLVDSPELQALAAHRSMFETVGLFSLVLLLIWAFHMRRGAQLFLFALMPIAIVGSAISANSELRQRLSAGNDDHAGLFVRAELDRSERDKLVVTGAELASLYRVLFYADDPRTTVMLLPPGAPLEWKSIPADRQWVLLVGSHPVPDDAVDRVIGDGYMLLRVPTKEENGVHAATTVDFVQPFRFGLVKSIRGLSVPQPFGRWSDSSEVKVEMLEPLPREFDLRLKARAFGPNAQKPFTIRIGDQMKTFRLAAEQSEVTIPFTTDGKQKLVTIQIPEPTSPQQLKLGSDSRPLGIALTRMTIVKTDDVSEDGR